MRKLFATLLLLIAATTAALALTPGQRIILLGGGSKVHDGISLNFLTQRYYTRVPGQAKVDNTFLGLFTYTGSPKLTLQSNGNLGWNRHNLLKYSNAQSNASGWTVGTQVTVTGAQTSWDGSTNATLIQQTTNNSAHSLITASSYSFAPVTWKMSAYLKPFGAQQWIVLSFGTSFASFDILNGVTGASANASGLTITSAGGGWYRCSFTGSATISSSTGNIGLNNADSATNTSFAGNTSNGAYATDALLSYGNVLFSMPAGLTTAGTVPAIDAAYEWDTSGNPLGILVEGARTNLVTWSQDATNAAWTKSGETVTISGTAPDGTATANLFTETASAGNVTHRAYSAAGQTWTANVNGTISVYLKANTRRYVCVSGTNGANKFWNTIDLTNGVISGTGRAAGNGVYTSSSITSVGNGWYRVTIVGQYSSGASTMNMDLTSSDVADNTTGAAYAFDAGAGSAFYFWGAQTEAGASAIAFASSYIPTTSASVARAADTITRTYGAEYLTTKGTAVIKFTPVSIANGSQSIFEHNSNSIHVQLATATLKTYDGTNTVGSATTTAGTSVKVSSSFGSVGGLQISAAGAVPVTGSYSGTWGAGTTIQLGATAFFGDIATLDTYPQETAGAALSNLSAR